MSCPCLDRCTQQNHSNSWNREHPCHESPVWIQNRTQCRSEGIASSKSPLSPSFFLSLSPSLSLFQITVCFEGLRCNGVAKISWNCRIPGICWENPSRVAPQDIIPNPFGRVPPSTSGSSRSAWPHRGGARGQCTTCGRRAGGVPGP